MTRKQAPADRYGNTRISKIRKAVNDLRRAIQREGTQDIQVAWDRLEPWIDAPIWKEE
ncbi:hypothetical protein [Roseovarius sp. MMSF_3281]|uniref:hypothetical protein n=1 Tax=Roseovarius sp. MMSF_3281 TaxID=3046694 RepID=UPI00273F7A08|nr:hypothetical protein [Roseovarius sp. MMSF_3281]